MTARDIILDAISRSFDLRGTSIGVIAEAIEQDLGAHGFLRTGPEQLRWQPIATAPRDGFGFLAFGVHDSYSGRRGGWIVGDYWWGIIQWDIWREPHGWVFGKDGEPTWSEPTHWMPLPAAPEEAHPGNPPCDPRPDRDG